MMLRLNAHAQYECMDLRSETKSKKCASDKNSLPGLWYLIPDVEDSPVFAIIMRRDRVLLSFFLTTPQFETRWVVAACGLLR